MSTRKPYKWKGADGKTRTITPRSDAFYVARELKRLKRVADFPDNTCPASRHTGMIGEALGKGTPYPMLAEEPKHCALSMLSTVGSLWEARTKIKRLEAQIEKLKARK